MPHKVLRRRIHYQASLCSLTKTERLALCIPWLEQTVPLSPVRFPHRSLSAQVSQPEVKSSTYLLLGALLNDPWRLKHLEPEPEQPEPQESSSKHTPVVHPRTLVLYREWARRHRPPPRPGKSQHPVPTDITDIFQSLGRSPTS